MKLLYYTIPSLALALNSSSLADFKHFIRQTELDPSLFPEYFEDIEVDAPSTLEVVSGSTPAAFKISEWGSRFDLYTTISSADGDELVRVASSVLGPFPTVSLSVYTEDDGTANENWTRADRQFGINVGVQGISSDPNAPDTFKKVVVRHIVKEYEADTYSFDSTENTLTWRSAKLDANGNEVDGAITGNGSFAMKVSEDDPSSGTSLHVLESTILNDDGDPDLDYAKGEEKVEVYVIAADGVTHNLMLEETVRIFPKHDFRIRGSFASSSEGEFKLSPDFDPNSNAENVYTEYSKFPNIHGLLDDIYPTSVIDMRVYEGKLDASEDTSKLGALVASATQITNDTNSPTSNAMLIESSALSANPDGFYTVILEYSTPFSKAKQELYSGFAVDRSMKVNANISTSE